MSKYFKIILIILSLAAAVSAMPVFADSIGTIEDNKPSWYAVIGAENKGKKLYVKGDIFYSDENPAKGLRILDIKKDALILEGMASKDGIIVKPGELIPIEGSGMIFEKTVEASVLEYNYNKPSNKVTKNQLEDFTIKNLEKKKIVLEKEYDKAFQLEQLSDKEKNIFSAPRNRDADKKIILTELFDKIESKKSGDGVWTLSRSSAESAINNTGDAIISAIKRVEPGYRFGEGPNLKFDTDLGVIVINKEGFLIQDITAAKLTENLGIMRGDVIKSINDNSLSSLFGIYKAYESIASDENAKLLNVDIVRGGQAKTLVYKIK
jgi:hypothetical protein